MNDHALDEGVELLQARRAFPLTDTGNAERFQAHFGDTFAWVPERRRWLSWGGRVWSPTPDPELLRAQVRVVRSIPAEHQVPRLLSAGKDRDSLADLEAWALRSESKSALAAFESLARRMLSLPLREFDQDPWLLAVANGTVDLRTGEVDPHRRDDHITGLVDVPYERDAECPRYRRFVHEITCGDPDLAAFLQRLAGYCVTADTSEQRVFLLHGRGSNGKSTLLRTWSELLGRYAGSGAEGLLVARRHREHSTEIASLRGKRLVVCSELDQNDRLDEARVKLLTGEDVLTARFMRHDLFEFVPSHKLILPVNHLPRVLGSDRGIWRRLMVVPFRAAFEGDQRDNGLREALLTEKPGILAWMVQGCLAWRSEGLGTCDSVERASAAYRDDEDVVSGFLRDCCHADPRGEETAQALYAAFESWSARRDEVPCSKRAFGQRLDSAGLQRRKGTGGVRLWRGVTLRELGDSDAT